MFPDGGKSFLDGLKAEGWLPNERGEYVCPQDPELFVRQEPTGKIEFSPKALEHLKRYTEENPC